uniref:GNAT family N-acetyltransferase n=1 Tax=Pararhizobium sp. IMCC3301 TaxID=3067904 RepID=UPI00274223DA|nr:GNAT family N-acetyltransferase [Pararhizobium sp. IMCC3301]
MSVLLKLILRPAGPGDLLRLAEIESGGFATDRISNRSFRALIASETAYVIVAEADGEILGYALVLFRRKTRVARLYSLAVDQTAIGLGLGKRLLAEAETETLRRGRVILRLEVHEKNVFAIALYKNCGYQPIGRYERYYGDGGTALRFEKNIRTNPLAAPVLPLVDDTSSAAL